MGDKVYIFGHRNPDTDAICAAISYADLKNKIEDYEAIPVRLGELNRETQFVLDYFKVPVPMFKDTIKAEVKDIKLDSAFILSPETSCAKALELMQSSNVNMFAVDSNERLVGIVSLSNITKNYMDVWDDKMLKNSSTPFENIVQVIAGDVLNMPKKIRELKSMRVFAMNLDCALEIIEEGDVVIAGNRTDLAEVCEKKIAILILTGGGILTDELKQAAIDNGVAIIKTEFNSFMASRLLPQAVPISYVMTKDNLISFKLDDYIDDVKAKMSETRFRSYPVLDNKGKIVGSISRYHLIAAEKKKIILVDHNERNQSIPDISDARIIEVVDHHRIANINTEGPIYFRNMPVGSTCTIIASIYAEKGITPSREIAGLICSGIISDTLLFRSPTSTTMDRMMLDRMAKIADIDPEKYAFEMFKAGTSLKGKSPDDLLNGDVKEFTIEGYKMHIGQVMTMDMDSLEKIKGDLLLKMEERRVRENEDFYIFILTDILKEFSQILVVGDGADRIARGFGAEIKNGSFDAPGVLSRKKQVVPVVGEALA